ARHLADCAGCRQLQAELAQAMTAFQTEAAHVSTPDPEEEWRLLQAQIRAPERTAPPPSVVSLTWLSLPLAAAAAVALVFWVGRSPTPFPPPPRGESTATLAPVQVADAFARADFVEVTDSSSSPLVYVDRDSGWLVVWAVETSASGLGD
ncbi:MAG: hypothetical protein Q8J74_02170, partial [Candidatus Didemnitutus sp.]|nr:hypothetical protein [Candidatus Didemnitutus sp.]